MEIVVPGREGAEPAPEAAIRLAVEPDDAAAYEHLVLLHAFVRGTDPLIDELVRADRTGCRRAIVRGDDEVAQRPERVQFVRRERQLPRHEPGQQVWIGRCAGSQRIPAGRQRRRRPAPPTTEGRTGMSTEGRFSGEELERVQQAVRDLGPVRADPDFRSRLRRQFATGAIAAGSDSVGWQPDSTAGMAAAAAITFRAVRRSTRVGVSSLIPTLPSASRRPGTPTSARQSP